MLKACPAVLQDLLDQYEALSVLHEQGAGPRLRQLLEDLSYTLCVTTGTRDVQSALAAAWAQLATEPTPATPRTAA